MLLSNVLYRTSVMITAAVMEDRAGDGLAPLSLMPDHWAAKVIPWLYASITVVGVLGNICVLITIFAVKRLHDTTNYLIANLALADLLFVVLCVPFTAYSYMRSWPFSRLFCVFSIHLQYICAYASVWTLVLLALDRFMVSRRENPGSRSGNDTLFLFFDIRAYRKPISQANRLRTQSGQGFLLIFTNREV
uniref:G_PROTEIN_RECEP_F1_2 domain-containing protein n=1 Tax=Steinernema glaseri TaxID=37863 RepID=A0A1I7ZXA9_9BILA